ncbi:MAG: radical SAM protein [Bacteroidetes bacterium]|nr:radical SAM protein [Bacteroidota bacterium]
MYSKCQGDKCICLLCPHGCTLRKGEKGTCGVRENRGNGCIELMCDGLVSGYANDPIEKKPLYHFYPGSRILSVGSFGCNLKCDFCQNSHISCGFNLAEARKTTPEAIVSHASQISQNIGIAFTYNEPVVWIEFMIRTAEKAKYDGLKTVMVSNGYVNPAALDDIIVVTDAFNIDLKFF